MAASDGVQEPPLFYFFMMDELFVPSSPAAPEMKSSLWSCLPEELVEEILLRLPASSQARFRLVSRAWLKLLASANFQERSAAIAFFSARYPCGFVHRDCLLSGDGDASSLSLDVPYKIHKLSCDFLPPVFREKRRRPPTVFSHRGLIAIARAVGQMGLRICVVNPVSQTWRALPFLGLDCGSSVKRVSLIAEKDGGFRFKIFVFSVIHLLSRGFDMSVSVYWSSTNKWVTSMRRVTREAVIVNDVPVGPCIAHSQYTYAIRRGQPVTLLVFSPQEGGYIPLERGKDCFDLHLVPNNEGDESVLLVPHASNSCEIWWLKEVGAKWVMLSRLPKDLLAKGRLLATPSESSNTKSEEQEEHEAMEYYRVLEVKPAGNIVFITLAVCERKHVVAYHILQRSWQIVLCEPANPVDDATRHGKRSSTVLVMLGKASFFFSPVPDFGQAV